MKIIDCRCESMKNPIGISIMHPRLTWKFEDVENGNGQESFEIRFLMQDAVSGNCSLLYESGRITSESHAYVTEGDFCRSRSRIYWELTVWDKRGEKIRTEERHFFEMGLLEETDWKAVWIEPEQEPAVKVANTITMPSQPTDIPEADLRPCQIVRKGVLIGKNVAQARIYATAHGIYRILLNGRRVGTYELAPEPTSYRDYLQVQTYDVTELLQAGDNVITSTIADGWWSGRLGNNGDSVQYGDRLGFLMQMEVLYQDGRREIIATDDSWTSHESPRRYADLLIGEKYDAAFRVDTEKIHIGESDGWIPVHAVEYSLHNLQGQNAPAVKVLEEYPLKETYISPKGEKILDFGQILAGNAAMKLSGVPGDTVTFSYFQEPDKEGNYWYEIGGMNSLHVDTYVLDEQGTGTYDPWFTYRGFRYIRVQTEKGNFEIQDACARLIASDISVDLEIETSNSLVNQLQENISRTLRSNVVSILTDNPDRERAGWTGDAEMIMPTAAYNLNMKQVMVRWLRNAVLEQSENGKMPLVVPHWETYANLRLKTSAGWEDACVLVPWILYQRYGDVRILEEFYPMMEKWVAYQKQRAEEANPRNCPELSGREAENYRYLWNGDFNFGDWLTPSACYNEETGTYTYFTQTLTFMMGTYYYAYTTGIMADISEILGNTEKAAEYRKLHERIRIAAVEEFYEKGLILESEYMGAQVLALHMGFYPEGEEAKLIERIRELVEEKGMDAGFSSAVVIEKILSRYGHSDIAYDFLLNEQFPSWLYEVKQGATGVWESMQAVMPDGTRNGVSFIQPAFCSIGNWMVEGMAGIQPAAPGFEKICLKPELTDRLSFVKAVYRSEQGEIQSCWKQENGEIEVWVKIPANASARIYLPKCSAEQMRKMRQPYVLFRTDAEGHSCLQAESGEYRFRYRV